MAELRTIVITETFKIDDVLTDLDSVPAFTAETGTSGVERLQDDEIVVAADTALIPTHSPNRLIAILTVTGLSGFTTAQLIMITIR
jgi:hypothetical protein